MQPRLGCAGAQEGGGGIESVPVRTDPKSVAVNFSNSCHQDTTDQAGQGTPCESSKDPKNSRKATSSRCHDISSTSRCHLQKETEEETFEEKKGSPCRVFN